MSNIITREELLSLLKKQQRDFTHHLQERIYARNWRTSPEYRSVTSIGGKICVNVGSLEAVYQVIAESAVDGVLSFIDVLSNPPDKPAKELEALKKRVARLELQFFKTLPPDFETPSSQEPTNN